MYVHSGYLDNSRVDFKDHTRPLIVGSCGTYRLTKRPRLPTWRPRGRRDFQLLYVASGKTHFFFGREEREEIVEAGNAVLYQPGEPQKYHYLAEERPEVFWVHFTGYDVKNILNYYQFSLDRHVFRVGSAPEYRWIFLRMISEFQTRRPLYEEFLASLLNDLLLLMNRQALEESRDGNQMREEMEQAISYPGREGGQREAFDCAQLANDYYTHTLTPTKADCILIFSENRCILTIDLFPFTAYQKWKRAPAVRKERVPDRARSTQNRRKQWTT